MFHNRALAATAVHAIIYVTFFLSGSANGRAAVTQDLSATILQRIPGVVEKLNSGNINERISVLDELVTVKKDSDLIQLLFRYDLPASDYFVVVKNIFGGDLGALDEKRASTTWWKLNHVIRVFKLKAAVPSLTSHLLKSVRAVQLDILRTLKTLQAVESVPQIVILLSSPEAHIRREALDTLVSLRAKEAVPALVALLQDKDETKRYYAMTSLVNVNGKEAAPAIAKALEDETENNLYWALDALVKLDAREYASALWRLIGSGQPRHTEAYALAALISFGEPRAIPLAVKKATDADLTRRTDMLEFLVKVKANAIAPALVDVLESSTVLGGNPSDTGTDSNIRRDIMTCLGQLRAREAIPVLRAYARGRESNTFLQRAAVMTLGVLGAKEAVSDLLPLLDERASGDAYATAEAGIALAQIEDRRTWKQLIDLAARPSCPYRSEIIGELNRHLDPELWERIQTQKVPGLYVKSVKTTVEAFNRESGIRIILDYQPGRDSSPRASLDGDGYPWANTSVEEISLIYGLREVIEAVSDDRTPRTFTFIFDDKQIHIVSVERAIEWWRKQVLSKNSNELKNTPDLPTVESCALIADPTQYDGREIRVTGVYSVCGTSDSKFFSSSCSSKTLWVEFAPNYQSCSDAKAISALTELRKKSGFRWARPHVSVVTAVYRAANVQFVGRFRASNPYAQEVRDLPVFGRTNSIRANYDFVLEVSCIERVKALPKDANY